MVVLRKVVKRLAVAVAIVGVAIGAGIGGFRLLVRELPSYQSDLQAWVAESLGLQLEFSRLDAHWSLHGPELTFHDARVAAAADVAGVLTTGSSDPWHPDAIRGAAGLQFALPVARVDELPATDRPIVALDPEGEDLRPSRLPADAVLAFGAERYGLTDTLLARADARIRIPMRRGVSSLNLATSVAAVLFAWRLVE
jgi:hypothetical protein